MKKLGKFKTIGEIFKKFAETEAYNLGFEFKETTKKSINRIAKEQEISIENYFDLLKELKDTRIDEELFLIKPHSTDNRIKKIDFKTLSNSSCLIWIPQLLIKYL